jgi:Tol biopolymer transport system component
VKTETDWNCLPETTPPAIRVLLHRCLRKDRNQRLADVSAVRIEIDDALAAPTRLEPAAAAPAQVWRRPIRLGLAALGIFVLGCVATWYLKPSAPRPLPLAHLVVALPPGDQLTGLNPPVEISPDGARLAYVATRNGVEQLFLRALDDPEAKLIPGTDGAFNPFFSPDGQWVGFFAQGKLKKVSIHGGVPVTLCDAGLGAGASWGTDDTIVFVPTRDSGLWRVPAAGGKAQVLTTPDPAKGEYSHRYPQILPGGRGVLFTALHGFGWDESRIELLRLDTKERNILVRGGHTGRYIPGGYLIYYRAGSLLAVPFNLARLELTSTAPVTVGDGARQSRGSMGADYSVSTTGTLAYISANPHQFESRLVWVDRQGVVQPIPAPPRGYSSPALSRDGKLVAVNVTSDTEQLWTYDLARGTLTQLPSEQGSSREGVWTADGKRVAYRSNRAGTWNLFWRSSDGSGSEERLTTSDKHHIPDSFSPDGQLLAFEESNPTTGEDIWVLRLGDPSASSGQARKVEPFLRTPFNESDAQFSPDGRWLAYASDESGGYEVYVQPYPGPGGKWRVSSGGGNTPRWNPNGRELFYQSGDKMMTVDVTTSRSFSAGTPKMLFEGQDLGWDVSPDGQRFLMVKPVEQQPAATQINIVLNWFEELKRRVPAGK